MSIIHESEVMWVKQCHLYGMVTIPPINMVIFLGDGAFMALFYPHYPLVICYIAIENGPVEILDLPSYNLVVFHSLL